MEGSIRTQFSFSLKCLELRDSLDYQDGALADKRIRLRCQSREIRYKDVVGWFRSVGPGLEGM